MKFAGFKKAVRTDGMGTAFLRALFNSKFVVINPYQVGTLVEAFGDTVRVDGLTFDVGNRLISTTCKGELIVDLYEKQTRQFFQEYFPRDEPLIELGGSIGVVSCTVNRSLISPDQHVVVEANPQLISTLKKNRDLNHCQFEIIKAAIAYDSPSVTFFSNGESLAGSVYRGEGHSMQVPTQTLQSIAEKAGFRHFNVISDIEGSEIDLIEHEMDFIREHVNFLFMEVHYLTPYAEEGAASLIETIQENGFEMLDKISVHYCFRNKATSKPEHKNDQ